MHTVVQKILVVDPAAAPSKTLARIACFENDSFFSTQEPTVHIDAAQGKGVSLSLLAPGLPWLL